MHTNKSSSLRIPYDEPGMRISEAAKILSMPRSTLYDMVRREEIPSRKVSTRGWQIPVSVVKQLAQWGRPTRSVNETPPSEAIIPVRLNQSNVLPPLKELLNDD